MRAMNVILMTQDEQAALPPDRMLVLRDRRADHIRRIIAPAVGDQLRVGQLNGLLGMATVMQISPEQVTLQVQLDTPPPPPLPATLLLALPRPKVLRRTLQACASLGVKQIYLINSYRVEKSYWQTPFLEPASLAETLQLGLEQGRDTMLPEVHLRKRFKPFVEDELPQLVDGKPAWTAHPVPDAQPCPGGITEPSLLAIGPEGGFITYEVDKLREAGFQPIGLGPRILKVETALPALLSKLYL